MYGSPNSKDSCSNIKPTSLLITQSGQSHITNIIILNVRLNYLPIELVKNSKDCEKKKCENILNVSIISGDQSSLSIRSRYIVTTSYSFSIEFDFGKEPIGEFTCQISLNNDISRKYFAGIDTSAKLVTKVSPALMSRMLGHRRSNKHNKNNKSGDLLSWFTIFYYSISYFIKFILVFSYICLLLMTNYRRIAD